MLLSMLAIFSLIEGSQRFKYAHTIQDELCIALIATGQWRHRSERNYSCNLFKIQSRVYTWFVTWNGAFDCGRCQNSPVPGYRCCMACLWRHGVNEFCLCVRVTLNTCARNISVEIWPVSQLFETAEDAGCTVCVCGFSYARLTMETYTMYMYIRRHCCPCNELSMPVMFAMLIWRAVRTPVPWRH